MPEQKKAIVPRLRFPEFRDAGPWEVKRLGEVAEIITERAADRECTLLSVSAGVGLIPQIEKFGREIAGRQRSNYFVVKKYDFAYNKSATKEYPQGYVGLYEGDELAAVPNSIFVCFRPNLEKIIPRYLMFLFEANVHGKWLSRFITVGARAHGSLNIDNQDLLNTPIPLPSSTVRLPEQQKIADCLSSLDELIELEAKKLEALKAHKKGLMQQLFPREGETTPRLRFPEFRNAGPWEVKRVGYFLTESRIDGSTGDIAKKLTVKLWGGGVVSKNEYLPGSPNTKYYRRKVGQFIYSKLDFLNGAFGIIPYELDGYESTLDLPAFDFTKAIVPRFFLEYVRRPQFYKKHGEQADGSRKAKRIQVDYFLDLYVAVPCLAEQQKIADCLSSLDELIQLEAQKLEALKAHKKGLMQQLFPQEIDL